MRLPEGRLIGFPACTMWTVTDGAWCSTAPRGSDHPPCIEPAPNRA